MKILITNLYIDSFRGSENWCYAMASELIRRGHQVDIYSPRLGKFFNEFEKIGCKFSKEGNYDLILENHNVLNRNKFKGFIIHTCHGIVKEEKPMSGVLNVAVANSAAKHWGIDIVIPNGIDCIRMKSNNNLNQNIKKVLSLCMSDTANDVLKTICSDMEVEFESLYGKFVFNVEDKINSADIVVGVGRSLLDAMACGRPVVSFDDRNYYKTRMLGYGYITPDKFDKYLKDSWTGNAEQKTLSKLDLAKEIFVKYNPLDGEVNRKFVLENYSIDKTVDLYLAIYDKFIAFANA